jgi:transposase-like protein
MPERKLTDPERRSLTLAALSGRPVSSVADEFGVSRSYVYKVRDDALENWQEELSFWQKVAALQPHQRERSE